MANEKEADTDRQAVEYGDQRVERGQGGETHQVASGDAPRLTTQQGIVVSDDQNSLRAGERDFISRCAGLRFWPRQASIAHRAGTAKASDGQG